MKAVAKRQRNETIVVNDRVVSRSQLAAIQAGQVQDTRAKVAKVVASQLMGYIAELDDRRRSLSHPDNVALSNMLGEIELAAFRQMRTVQDGGPSRPVDPWGSM